MHLSVVWDTSAVHMDCFILPFTYIHTIHVWSLCGTYCCLSCALQSTTFLQPLTEKPQSNRGVYFGATTGPRLVHMKKVRTYLRM